MLRTHLQVPLSDAVFQTAKLPAYAFLLLGDLCILFASRQQLIQSLGCEVKQKESKEKECSLVNRVHLASPRIIRFHGGGLGGCAGVNGSRLSHCCSMTWKAWAAVTL